ncbi:MAG TPA: inner membrane-spanning protein YciB [Steroidobacteraceae bacterium]|nr:inner membrane-spanning protein YciB [Steroidobacteraceae bacterium]
MQALTDFLPVLAFFVAFKFAGIYVATGVLIAATGVQVAVQWLRRRTVSRTMLYSALLVLLFGGATLYFHNELVLMWMPTVLYVTLALAFLVTHWIGPPLVERVLGEQLKTDARTWRIANLSWVVFFLVLAVVNLAFVYRYGLNAWVGWKLAKVGVIFVFVLAQAVWLAGRAEHPEDKP